ncbi:MAG TPA: TIGR03915 family putative DNA repair protein [Bacillota bacterium]|nr:TIGR03915 family putative DNA repair protein [Bacillota bacterium]
MVDYLYDGTFEGLLTCIYHNYYGEKASGIFPAAGYQSHMLGGYKETETDEEKADRVYDAVARRISDYDLGRIYKVFMSSAPEKENKILNYLRLGFKKGSCISLLHGDPTVFAVQAAEKKVNNEIHRLKGLVRFSAMGSCEYPVYYSAVEPDNDVIEFLARHFCDRFKNQAFIIHDIKRSKALIASGGSWYISSFFSSELPPFSEDEQKFRDLWKKYFDSTAIKERTNARCQKNFMPVRYWKHLTEMQPRIDSNDQEKLP